MEQDILKRELQETADGSHTLFIPAMDEHYHSVNGAMQESMHIFIDAGLHAVGKDRLRIFEVGFGTGLNAFLTLKEVETGCPRHIDYHSVERYPLDLNLVRSLNYGALAWPERKELFLALHTADWNVPVSISDRFTLHKIEGDSHTCALPDEIDLIYFDAFAPEKQPEMWSREIYDRLYAHTAPGGILVTYCAKGDVRRGMQGAGFQMSRLPGPPGKRHMLLGVKE